MSENINHNKGTIKKIFDVLLRAYAMLFVAALIVACVFAVTPGNLLCAPPIYKTKWYYILPVRQIACFLGEPIMTEDIRR